MNATPLLIAYCTEQVHEVLLKLLLEHIICL